LRSRSLGLEPKVGDIVMGVKLGRNRIDEARNNIIAESEEKTERGDGAPGFLERQRGNEGDERVASATVLSSKWQTRMIKETTGKKHKSPPRVGPVEKENKITRGPLRRRSMIVLRVWMKKSGEKDSRGEPFGRDCLGC